MTSGALRAGAAELFAPVMAMRCRESQAHTEQPQARHWPNSKTR